jgi:glycosyltransferase involved in cell wall biosynthesis
VPSKTLSYLCAGRPVLGLVPAENLAAELIERAGGFVGAPAETTLDEAAEWTVRLLDDAGLRDKLGRASRDLAEEEFALEGCANRFEAILRRCSR